MSAAYWRRAMNTGLAAAARPLPLPKAPAAPLRPAAPAAVDPYPDSDAPRWLKFLWQHLSARHVFVLVVVLVYPFVATPFLTFQIAGQALALGLIALSLTFLGGYGGMVSLAQMAFAGLAGYLYAILFGHTGGGAGWHWTLAIPLSLAGSVVFATLTGLLSVRTAGIYTIMITLAVAVAFFYFCQQNYDIFNGFRGYAGLAPPMVFGVDWRQPLPFYYLALGTAVAGYLFVVWLSRSTFGVALQAIRDNPRRGAPPR